MRFTVDLEGDLDLYRLQTDQSWRNCLNATGLAPTDMLCDTVEDALALNVLKGEFQIENVVFDIEPEPNTGFLPPLHYTSSVFRREFPTVPSVDQLREVIRTGDDSVNNSLILNIDSMFELRSIPPYDFSINDPTCVVRYETFDAGNDYAGVEASEDDDHILTTYALMMSGWVEHLKNGATQLYYDEYSPISIEDLPQMLDEIQKAWVPQYE
jgi:hypothetical protein